MTIDGKQWGVPYTYYQWGVYYREGHLRRVRPRRAARPGTSFKSNCQTLLDNGVKCFTIGTKFLWTAAGWFDYLNLRTNGYDFHMQLTAGEVPWTDDRVRQTFANWRELIDMGAYIDNHTAYSWQEALPFMVQGDAAAYLMGNFAVAPHARGGLTDDQLDYYQFPAINPDVEMAEDAPTDTFHIPAGAENKEDAQGLPALRRLAREPDADQRPATAGPAAGQREPTVGDDKFLQRVRDAVANSPGGIAQFFDRDAPAEMAKIGMEGFQEFMVSPDNSTRSSNASNARGRASTRDRLDAANPSAAPCQTLRDAARSADAGRRTRCARSSPPVGGRRMTDTTPALPTTHASQPRGWWARNQIAIAPWLFIAPGVLFFAFYVIFPIFQSFQISFYALGRPRAEGVRRPAQL